MKTYHGSTEAGHRTCQALGQIAEGQGATGISPQRLAERIAIERLHDPEAQRATYDATETERFQRLAAELPERCPCCREVSDRDPVAILIAFGLSQRNINLLENNGCEEIADVRSALLCGEIPTWFSCSDGTEKQVRAAVKRMDAK